MKNILKFFEKILCVFSAIVVSVVVMPMETANAELTEIDELEEMISELAVLVNAERADKGIEPVYVVPYLNEVAETRAKEITVSFVHERPDGEKWNTVIDDEIVPYSLNGELIICGNEKVDRTFKQILDSPVHYNIMTNESMTHMGVGVAHDPDSEYKWYWQLTFVNLDTDWCDYLGWQTDDNGNFVLDGQYSVYQPTSYRTGDINGDGIIDSFDLVLLRRFLLKEITFTSVQMESADILYDGAVSYLDAFYLKKYIFGEINELPAYLF
ncbi:MAG: hypothetical protein K2J08_06910 [Ruminococcus sp.]|nr:hypothetical protein [Ruminococcus sp.]